MTFLNPIFLWASFAIAIPIIVHLFNFRRPKKIQFSDISLVQEVKRSVVRRLRLRQWLLLATRCLAILALVMVFAGPVIKGEGATEAPGSTSIAIMVDNSYSMQGGNEKGSYWLQAQKAATEIIKAYGRTDEFMVMSTHEPLVRYNFGEQQAALKTLKSLGIHQNTRSLPEILTQIEDVFANASYQKKSFYFLSDFQRSTILPDTAYGFKQVEGLEVNLLPLTTRQLKNAFVADHQVVSQIVEVDRPVEMSLNLVNDAKDPLKNVGLRVVMGDEVRPVSTEDLEAGENKSIKVNLTPQKPGWQSGYIELDDSPVDFDNRRYFTYYVPEKEKMLVVEEKPLPQLRIMFGGDLLSQFDTKFVSFRNFGEENLDDYKSIMLVGLTDISTGLQEKLQSHLEQGKSILYFPGVTMGPGVNRFFKAMEMGAFEKLQSQEEGAYASGVDLEHPIFDGMFVGKRDQSNFDAPQVYKYYRFRPGNAIVQNVILKLDNQDPVLIESRPKGGLFYNFAFLPREDWTDFTIKGVGLSMMVQVARLMNQTQRAQQNLDLGTTAYKRVKTQEKDVVRMIGMDSTEFIPEQFVQSGYIVLKFSRQDLPEGNYELRQNGKLLEYIAFNVPDSESRLESLPEQELKEYLAAAGLDGIQVTQAAEGGIAQEIEIKNNGLPLWKFFLIAALVFLLIEFILLVVKRKTVTA